MWSPQTSFPNRRGQHPRIDPLTAATPAHKGDNPQTFEGPTALDPTGVGGGYRVEGAF